MLASPRIIIQISLSCGEKKKLYKRLIQDKQTVVLFEIFLFIAQCGLVQKFLCSSQSFNLLLILRTVTVKGI